MGTLLVVLQFALLLALALFALPPIRAGGLGSIPVAAYGLAAASVALGLWTLAHNRLGNFNIRPAPKAGGVLITTGPYRWIRHPMYPSVLLGAAALAWTSRPIAAWAAWSALAVVLYLKSRLEEGWMRKHHGGYGAYAQGTKRFVPWLL